MKMFNGLMAGFFAVGLMVGTVQIVRATCANDDIECYKVGDTQKFRISKDGNVEIAGTETVTGAVTVTGATTQTGAVTFNGALTANSTVTLSTTSMTAGFVPMAKTAAQMNLLSPTTTGQLLYCSDCTKTIICVSSGSHPTTSIGAWVAISTAPTVATMLHCQ